MNELMPAVGDASTARAFCPEQATPAFHEVCSLRPNAHSSLLKTPTWSPCQTLGPQDGHVVPGMGTWSLGSLGPQDGHLVLMPILIPRMDTWSADWAPGANVGHQVFMPNTWSPGWKLGPYAKYLSLGWTLDP